MMYTLLVDVGQWGPLEIRVTYTGRISSSYGHREVIVYTLFPGGESHETRCGIPGSWEFADVRTLALACASVAHIDDEDPPPPEVCAAIARVADDLGMLECALDSCDPCDPTEFPWADHGVNLEVSKCGI